MIKLKLKKYSEKRIRNNYLWIFSNEIENLPKELPAGTIVEIEDNRGHNYGIAFFNPNTLIAARLLLTKESCNFDFFQKRIANAYSIRQSLFPNQDNYRLIYAESDYLPGLVVDKYGDYLAIQILSAGIEHNKELILDALLSVVPNVKGIIEKSKSRLRQIEGLEEYEGILWGEIPEFIIINENNVKLNLNLQSGQKTGYFLDQKVNRQYLQTIAKDKTVLDCFTNQGGFALNAAKAGAKYSLGIDSSQEAIDLATNNAEINNLKNIEFLKAEVVKFLENEVQSERRWDIIVLDPPSFAKNRKSIPVALHGYQKINKLAMQCLKEDGILVSSSCTQVVDEANFLDCINTAASKTGKQLQTIFRGSQSPCHPILLSMSETNYLKFYAFRVSSFR